MAHETLVAALLPLSHESTWEAAKKEWSLEAVFLQVQPQQCLCGHSPIYEVCVLRNQLTGNSAEVGNVCVKKFLGLPSDKIFKALRRAIGDEEQALGLAAIEFAHERHWIDDWDLKFYRDTGRKKLLSEKQLAHRVRINRRTIQRIRRLQ